MGTILLAATAALPTPLIAPPVLSVAQKCTEAASTNEIVVCARPNDQRIKQLTGPQQRPPLRAEAQVAKGVKAGLVAESAALGGGATSNRAMVRVKIAF